MKKFFQFSGTINGTTFFLRILFSAVLSVPALIITFAFFGVFAIEYAEIEISSYENIESVLMHDQSMEEIRNYINSMPESLKTAFTLRESGGKSYEEISNITATPIGTVRSRIFRARESIIEFMQKELIDNE